MSYSGESCARNRFAVATRRRRRHSARTLLQTLPRDDAPPEPERVECASFDAASTHEMNVFRLRRGGEGADLWI